MTPTAEPMPRPVVSSAVRRANDSFASTATPSRAAIATSAPASSYSGIPGGGVCVSLTIDRDASIEATLLEATKAQLAHRIQSLESRERVVQVAAVRLNMHVPSADEIVLLPASRPVEVASR